MNSYVLSLLMFGYGTFFTSLFIAFKRNDELGKAFVIFSVFVSSWGIIFSFVANNAISHDAALLSARTADTLAIFISPSWLYLVSVFLGIEHRNKWIIRLVYLSSIIMASFCMSPLLIPDVKPIMDFAHWTQPGLVFHFFTAQFFIVVFFGFCQMIVAWRKSNPTQRMHIQIFTVATLCGFTGGGLTFLPIYGISFPQQAIYLMPLYPFIMAYAMVRHGLIYSEEVLAIHRDKLALLGLMSSSINHEIKNPLFILQELSKKTISNLDGNQEAKKSLGKMSEQIDRMNKLVTRLGEFARPGQGVEPINVRKVVEDALFFASQELNYHNIQVKIDIDLSLPKLMGDKSQFEEIFLNLIVNAYHAMEKGGALAIQGMRVGNFIQINLSDTGTGIPKSDLKNIFKPFYTTKEKTGTGLGLHIVKTLVEQNGGKISVDSEVGNGTKFSLRFPAANGILK